MEYKIWSNRQGTSVPTVFIHSFRGNGEDVWNACQAIHCPPFNLVSIYNFDADNDISPWPAEGVRKGQDAFGGKATEHLKVLIDRIIPEVESQLDAPSLYLAMAGYSLAGLFTLWSLYQTDLFQRIACISSSFWYPGFIPFVEKETMKRKPDCIYFSLGNKESKTNHPLMKMVADNTEIIIERMKGLSIHTTYEINPGNHFTEPDRRTAKAILWMLNQPQYSANSRIEGTLKETFQIHKVTICKKFYKLKRAISFVLN